MNLPGGVGRVSKRYIPSTPCVCPQSACVYNRGAAGVCDDPQNNHGNGDAECHRTSPKDLIAMLARPATNEETRDGGE